MKKQREGKLFSQIVQRNTRRMRYDIANWRTAMRIAENVDNPNRARLYDIFSDIMLDALLTSQIQNRKLQVLGTPYELLNESGEVDESYTAIFTKSMWFPGFLAQLMDTNNWSHSVWEITLKEGKPAFNLIPRKHVKPSTGEILKYEYDTNGANGACYRDMRVYGQYVIEAGDNYDLGLLNKAVPHVLMKRFAQSCWSEFCEIFGMPMRVVKTNTSDPEMLNRAEEMQRNMGAANWAVIDESEAIEIAGASTATGEVYKSLINLCNNEISLLIQGAILGQDTEHGTRGKEQVSSDILSDLVRADIIQAENYINAHVIPALVLIDLLPDGMVFKFKESEDIDGLWGKVRDALPYFEVDPTWIEDKFNIPVTQKTKQSADGFFG